MPREIRIPLTEEQEALIEKTAAAAGITVEAVMEEAASGVLRCLHAMPMGISNEAERFTEAYLPEERWREVQAQIDRHWSAG